ncbi:MAG: hypothetical protein NT013_19830 [Planctomycetia bacterium]|nr:hypothetical protein [Planctomycetia bacterium]
MADSPVRQSWLDDKSQTTLIDDYTQKLVTFMEAISDGHVDDAELAAQEQRLVERMNEVEPSLDDALHDKVTRLLCELTAFNVMQTLHSLQANRPQTKFLG